MNQDTHASVAISTASLVFQGPRRWNTLAFQKAVDGLGQGIVVTVTRGADRRLDACLGQALGVAIRQVLRPPVGEGNEAVLLGRSTRAQSLL